MKTVLLKRVVDPRRPITYGIVQAGPDVPGGVPYVRPADMHGHAGVPDLAELRTTSPEIAATYRRSSVRTGDLIVSIGPSFGKTMVVPPTLNGANLTQGTARVAPSRQIDHRYLVWALQSTPVIQYWESAVGGATFRALNLEPLACTPVPQWPMNRQRAIADYLDTETGRIDSLIAKKQSLLDLLDERIDAMISATIEDSALVDPTRPALEIRKLLLKRRVPGTVGNIVTAFRDGQVTARALRRAEGYTESWTDNPTFQQVRRGDVVVHGLDGFAGAVGTAEADGICSPVYHVMEPLDGGDEDFYGRLLHVLAKTGYLGLFAVSTRERAVDFRNWDLFGRIPIPAVSPDRQREIGSRVRSLRPLRSAVVQSKALALEHRQALITAAVTGELEIPGVAS